MSGYGSSVTIEIVPISNETNYQVIRTVRRDQGRRWVEVKDMPIAHCQDYRVRIVAVLMKGANTRVALDDFRFRPDSRVTPREPSWHIPRDRLCFNDAKYLPSTTGHRQHQCCCQPGFTGEFCQTNINDCEMERCLNGATCLDQVDGFSCHCSKGYKGQLCEVNVDDCKGLTCYNGGTCTDVANGYTCNCTAHYTGDRCEIKMDACTNMQCENEGKCHAIADGTFFCECADGFEGEVCEVDVSMCTEGGASNPCGARATCIDGYGAEYWCVCAPGTVLIQGINGPICVDEFDSCASTPCVYGGACKDTHLGYSCSCPEGTQGQRCQINTDDCDGVNCQNSGVCIDGVNGYQCRCKEGFTGKLCELDNTQEMCMEDCIADNTARCTWNHRETICICRPGYEGKRCQQRINYCKSNPCVEGTCTVRPRGYSCGCNYGYTGINCDQPANFCTQMDCGEKGACHNTFGKAVCVCEPGYTGSLCESKLDPCGKVSCDHGGWCKVTGLRDRPWECICISEEYSGRFCEKVKSMTSAAASPPLRLQVSPSSQMLCADFWKLPQSLRDSVLTICIALNLGVLGLGLIIIELCARSLRRRKRRREVEVTPMNKEQLGYPYPTYY